MNEDMRNNMGLVNNLIESIEALQKAGISVTLRQEKNGKFDVGMAFDTPKIRVNASYPKQADSER